jgi:opacity protein-like surface antigen
MQAIMMPNGQVYVVVPAQPQQVAPMMIPPQQMVQQQPMVMPQPQVMPVQPQYYAAPPQQQPVVIPQQSVVIPQQPMVAPQQRRPPVQVAKTVPRQTAHMIQGGRKKKPRFYAGLRGIYSSLNDLDGILHRDAGSLSFSESAGFGVAVGYRLSDAIRGEVEFSRHQYDLKEFYDRGANTLSEAAGEVTFNTTMISGYYDYLNDSQFTPYIGAGVGATLLEVDRAANFASGGVSGSQLESRSSLSGEQWVPSIMLSAGSTYDLNEQLSLDLAYRALFTGDVAGTHSTSTGSTDELFSHNTLFGLMYSFDGF